MSNKDMARVVLQMEAEVGKLRKDFDKAEKIVEGSGQKMARASNKAAKSMESTMSQAANKIGGAFKASFAGIASGIAAGGLAGIAAGVREVAKGIAEVGDQAKTAGLSLKDFQRWKYAAEQNRIGLDGMIDGFKELQLRSDEYAKTGSGSAAESFQRLGMSREEVQERLKNPSDLMLELIDRTRRLKDTAAGIRIFDELLGGQGGEQFVRLIEQGRAGLTATLTEAEKVSDFMSEDMVRSAQAVDQAFHRISTTVGTGLKRAVVEAYDALVAFKSIWVGIQDSSADGLLARQSQLETRRKQLEAQKGTGEDTFLGWFGKDAETELKAVDEQLKQINDELAKRKKIIDSTKDEPPVTPLPSTGSGSSGKTDLTSYLAAGRDSRHVTGMSSSFESKLEKMFAALPKELAGQIKINSGFRSNERQAVLWQQALEKYGSVAEARKWVAPPGNSQHNKGMAADLGYGSDAARSWAHDNASKFGLSFPLGNEPWHVEDAGARSGMVADKTKELESRGAAYDQILEKARMYVASQNLERDALGMTEQAAARLRYEQELLNEAQQAGITLNPTQSTALKQLAADMAEAETRTRSLAQSQLEAQQSAADFASEAGGVMKGFVSDLIRGEKASDALKNALARIADMALDSALSSIFGGGGQKGGGLLGALLGGLPKREHGGPVSAGQPYIVGEKRAEVFVPSTAGRIVPRVGVSPPRAPRLNGRAAPAANNNQPGILQVHINGASGDPHVRELVKQGVGEALAAQNDQMRRGGFGTMQARFGNQKA